MTIHKAIAELDTQLPNTVRQDEKVQWLSRIDMQAKREILDTHVNPQDFNGYEPDTSLDTQLLIPAPYDECYIRYMEAQVHYVNGEMSRYKNAMMLFNAVYAAYSDYFNRTHMPVDPGYFCF